MQKISFSSSMKIPSKKQTIIGIVNEAETFNRCLLSARETPEIFTFVRIKKQLKFILIVAHIPAVLVKSRVRNQNDDKSRFWLLIKINFCLICVYD